MAVGQALVVVSVVVIDSYAIPEQHAHSRLPRLRLIGLEPLFFQKGIEVFVPPPIIRTPDALSKVGLSAHAQLFHNPTRSNVLGLTGSDHPMQAQRLKAISEHCHS